MSKLSGSHLCIYISGILIVLLLLGLYNSRFSPDDNPFEHFTLPTSANSSEQSSGSSSLFGWGYQPLPDDSEPSSDDPTCQRRCPSCENIYIDKVDIITPSNAICRTCDITKNKDIDKYVLKSSIPPCPDMSEYAKKWQLPPAGFNPEEWIRKSEIPPCPTCPDLRNYVHKSEIPACDPMTVCPKCPECPVCPKCPPCEGFENKKQVKWTPKLSEVNSGFISKETFAVGNACMARRNDELI